jgi:hypothetical protein
VDEPLEELLTYIRDHLTSCYPIALIISEAEHSYPAILIEVYSSRSGDLVDHKEFELSWESASGDFVFEVNKHPNAHSSKVGSKKFIVIKTPN